VTIVFLRNAMLFVGFGRRSLVLTELTEVDLPKRVGVYGLAL
jgi:hypothetical protein